MGIESLRFILCLWIVILHCSNIKNKHKKYLERGFHVPTFIIISFYYYYPLIQNRIIMKIILRFQRMLIPYILWPLLILILNNFLTTIFSFGQFKTKLSLYDFYIQIVIGARYHAIFWFQFNLIFLSLYLTIIAFIFKDNFLDVVKFLGILSLYLHYSKINLKMFSSFHRGIQISIGSLQELKPLSIIGCIFGSINLLMNVKNIPKHLYFILFILMHFLFIYNIFIFHPGFMYPNIILNILASTILFLTFGSLYLNEMMVINSIIKYITKFTGGIYYIHSILRIYLQKYILFFKLKSYFSSFVIYFICYIICYIGASLFKKNRLKYLFI